MGLLGDLYSTIDSKKRQLRGLLSDPVETLYQGVRNFGAEQQGLLDMQARAYPWTGMDRNAVPDLAARKALADAGAAQGMAAATVWHGSPHKFDKFDASKIGTGEGAQAYGHGLYLAESPDVAKSYLATGQAVKASDRQTEMVARAIDASGGDEVAARAWLRNRLSNSIPEYKELYSSALKSFDSLKPQGSSLYKVDLPDDAIAKMLDWDKLLSQQAPEVQKIIKTSDFYKQAKDYQKATGASYNDPSTRTGEGILKYMRSGTTDEMGNAGPWSGGKSAEEYLKSIGIPGIRYLDGGSRGAGQGSSNFVVFPGNEGLLSILERNGKPIK
jgi:hypothetical protein